MKWLAYRLYRSLSSLLYSARRRLTPAGWIVLVCLILTGGMATDTQQSLGYQAFALLLCLTLVSILAAPFFRVKFTAERFLPKFGTVGQSIRYSTQVKNMSQRTQTGLQLLDGIVDPRPTFEEFVAITRPTKGRRSWQLVADQDLHRVRANRAHAVPWLPPNGWTDVEMEIVPLKRGVLHFQSVTLARPDPFVLFRAFSSISLPGSITVLPRRYALPPIALPGSQRYQHGGVAFAASVGEAEEFVSLRDYRPGDPMRRIHWRSWAKAGRPVVKEYQDEFFVRHALILDTFTAPNDGELFEEAVSVAASFACTLETQESLLDLLFVGPQAFCFTIGRGVAHADQMLELLASVKPCADQPFSSLEQLVIEHASAVSGCICLFLAWNEPRRRLVRKLSALDVPVLVLVLSEQGAPEIERDAHDPEALHVLKVGNIEADLAKL